jgi:hypothetical protein
LKIKIKRIESQTTDMGGGDREITETYSVIDDGRDFTITLKSHRHGSRLGVVGQEGVLYTDRDNNTVRRQVITVGRSCGVTIDADELVEGLSVWSIRGVIFANRTGEGREITLNVERSENGDDQPVILIDGQAKELDRGL